MFLPAGNRIIDAVSRHDATDVLRNAQVVTLARSDQTTLRERRMETVDFPVTALMSVMGGLEDGATCEIASVGPEAFVEIDAALRNDVAKRTAQCVLGGDVIRVPLADFQNGLAGSSLFADRVYRAVRARVFVTEQVAMCSARHSIAERLARWLLLTSFRIGRDEFSITHDFLAGILGARRASISEATSNLEAGEAIGNRRNVVTIRDHARLEEYSCECCAVCRRAIEEGFQDDNRSA